MTNDPISDLLARLRNGALAGHSVIELPTSRVLLKIAEIFREEGYVAAVREIDGQPRKTLRINLKPATPGNPAFRGLQRVSRPSRRIYRKAQDLRPVLRGMGLAVVSTSKGILSDKECRARRLGGEVLLKVW